MSALLEHCLRLLVILFRRLFSSVVETAAADIQASNEEDQNAPSSNTQFNTSQRQRPRNPVEHEVLFTNYPHHTMSSSECCFAPLAWLAPSSQKKDRNLLDVDDDVMMDPHEAYYRVWYAKGLLGFTPRSLLGKEGNKVLSKSKTAPASQPPAESTAQEPKTASWSDQMSIQKEPQSQGMHGYWEKRSASKGSVTE